MIGKCMWGTWLPLLSMDNREWSVTELKSTHWIPATDFT